VVLEEHGNLASQVDTSDVVAMQRVIDNPIANEHQVARQPHRVAGYDERRPLGSQLQW
jgi:hypothetical protein